MRDLLLLVFIFGGLLGTIRYPFIGVLLWAWFTLATPQLAAYSASALPLNTLIAGVTFIACFLHGEFKRFRPDLLSIILVIFAGWLTVSQMNSLDPKLSAEYYDRFLKILIFILLIMMTATTRLRFHTLLWLYAIVMGFQGAKGGLYTIATFGQNIYYGIPNSVLHDNNHIGIALAVTLPVYMYLYKQVAHIWIKRALAVIFVLSIIAILGTHSRGALVALVVFGGLIWLQSERKLLTAVLAIAFIVPASQFLPDHWFDRMETIKSAQEDDSFNSRVDAWIINYKIANRYPLTGAGLRNPYNEHISQEVEPDRVPRAAHSIYFEVLGGAGYVGLLIYLSFLGFAYLKAVSASTKYRFTEHDRWRADFGKHVQTSLVVFGVAAASVSLEMWEGYLLLIALIAVLHKIDPEAAEVHKRKSRFANDVRLQNHPQQATS
jgi:probable O-glycosylation ligase (exosortase A-associated)